MTKKLLLIEDNPGDARLLREMLAEAKAPFEMEWVQTLSSGMERLANGNIDLVVLDLHLPDSQGLETFTELHGRVPEVPVVVMSGLADENVAMEALKKGAQDYFIKGQVDSDLLARSLQFALARYKLQSQVLRRAEETIHHLAYYDPLTSLPNRVLLMDRLNMALACARRNKETLAVLFLDLDRFKVINDTLGHSTGDELLKVIAERLRSSVRESDAVARLGGDEFVLLLPGIKDTENTVKISYKILQLVRQPMRIGLQELNITTSIGIALYPNDGEDGDTLLKNADAAMYHAKEQGRNNYQVFTQVVYRKVHEQLVIESNVLRGLEREEFVLYYQPQVDLNTLRIVGMEALIRWQHPERGLLSPSEFIPLLERNGQIVPVGEWVLRATCAQSKAWQEAGFSSIRMAVNLSAIQIRQRNLVEVMRLLLKENGINPSYLELEVTESAIMEDVENSIYMLDKLRGLGISIALDDFGTGYSSLSYLRRFSINTLKIDASFVHDIPLHADDITLVTTIIIMAKSLKLKTIAEGVETIEQLEFLNSLKCDEVQGYFFSPPVPAEEAAKLLSNPYRPLSRGGALPPEGDLQVS